MFRSRSSLTAQCFVSWSTTTTTAAMRIAPRSRANSELALDAPDGELALDAPDGELALDAPDGELALDRRRAGMEGYRRPMPPTFSSTSTVAHGMASSRSRG